MTKKQLDNALPSLLSDIRQVIEQARGQVKQVVNSAMVAAYWKIGRLIVEEEQKGAKRAKYGKAQLQQLSQHLSEEYGSGFDVRNLRNMRKFYQTFRIRNAVRTELSWTHYRTLLRIESEVARHWYMQECIDQAWSARALERQISKLYYERLLSSQNKALVEQEAQEKTKVLEESAKNYLDMKKNETKLEDAIILFFRGKASDAIGDKDGKILCT